METPTSADLVALRPWTDGDEPLLHRLMGDPAMTEHLGGPESAEKLADRHRRYLALNDGDCGRMLVITVAPDGIAAGSIGYWEREWNGETVWETGWAVLPELQGRGIATAAKRLVVEVVRATGRHRSIHAYPKVANAPSNAICRKAGFTLRGEVDFEYPAGHPIRCNDWAIELDRG